MHMLLLPCDAEELADYKLNWSIVAFPAESFILKCFWTQSNKGNGLVQVLVLAQYCSSTLKYFCSNLGTGNLM